MNLIFHKQVHPMRWKRRPLVNSSASWKTAFDLAKRKEKPVQRDVSSDSRLLSKR